MNFGDNRLPQNFWDKVHPEPNTGCWLWSGNYTGRKPTRPRYGRNYAHRVTCSIVKGPCPDGLEHSHLCHTPSCVNPDHLVYETHAQNTARNRGRFLNSRSHADLAHLSVTEYRREANARNVTSWRERFKARDPEGYRAFNRTNYLRKKERKNATGL